MHFTSFSIFDNHLNLFEPELSTWRNVTGRYRFGRIKTYSRWILCCLDAPDYIIPVRLRERYGPCDPDPVAREKRREMLTGG
jgi:hypothetical protein